MQNDFPSAQDFEDRRVTNPAQSEVIRQRFYDYQLYALPGAQQLSFFSLPIGQGITTALGAGVGTPKTKWDTNLVLANSLPSGNAYFIQSVEVLFLPGSSAAANTYTPANLTSFAVAAALTVPAAVNDVHSIYQSGLLELNILNKVYLSETPLIAFPPKAHIGLDASVASNSATVGESAVALAKATGRPYYVQPEISLQPAVNFNVVISWPGLVPTPSTFNGRIGVILDGYFMRASQ